MPSAPRSAEAVPPSEDPEAAEAIALAVRVSGLLRRPPTRPIAVEAKPADGHGQSQQLERDQGAGRGS